MSHTNSMLPSDNVNKCCICMEQVDYRGSSMIQCGKCKIHVHVQCYGVTLPPNNSIWFCEACMYVLVPRPDQPDEKTVNFLRMQPFCAVCPIAGGALRETQQRNVWCHVVCMNWIPELSHSLPGVMDEKVEIRLLDRSRESLKCLVCGQRGGCIQCVSGRCARAFHILCAMRCPSDILFTGYTMDNQQVYHCKTHLSEIATFKYEIVDHSWKQSPALVAFLKTAPTGGHKCRVCQSKTVPSHLEKHETMCFLAWIVKEDIRIRKKTWQEFGVSAIPIQYKDSGIGAIVKDLESSLNGKVVNEETSFPKPVPSQTSTGSGTPGKRKYTKRNSMEGPISTSSGNKGDRQGLKPCPQCGQRVLDSKMMAHMKNRCSRRRDRPSKGPTPSGLNRQHHPRVVEHKDNGDGEKEVDEELVSTDLSDVLFATWPGQAAGSMLDTTTFWRIVNAHCFRSKGLLKKRMEPMCKHVCGAKFEDMSTFATNATHELLTCSDMALLTREQQDQALALQSLVHRCDFMMRRSRMRCVEDVVAKPVLTVRPLGLNPPTSTILDPALAPTATVGDWNTEAIFRVLFANTSHDTAAYKFSLRTQKPEAETAPDAAVWSRFHHDSGATTLSGVDVEQYKVVEVDSSTVPPSTKPKDVWMAVQDTVEDPSQAQARLLLEPTTTTAVVDELTPEISLLVAHLAEHMRSNRFKMRALCRQTSHHDEVEKQCHHKTKVTEAYYHEYAMWKALCRSLLLGYRANENDQETTQDESKEVKGIKGPNGQEEASEDGDEDAAIDDGTCVVCFDGQSPESNPIIFCDRCNLAVHQHCYGVPHVPPNEFYCDRCRYSGSTEEGNNSVKSVCCQLCPLRDGAFKRTVDDKWVHVVCALWCPGVWIGDLRTLGQIRLMDASTQTTRFVDINKELAALITGASSQPPSLSNDVDTLRKEGLVQGTLCMYCRVACGRTIRCCHKGEDRVSDCTTSFHPLCGWYYGLTMTTLLDKSVGFVYSGGGAGLGFKLYCPEHPPAECTTERRLAQSKRRHRFRIDVFSMSKEKKQQKEKQEKEKKEREQLADGEKGQSALTAATIEAEPWWTDQELCAACFEYATPLTSTVTGSPTSVVDCTQLTKQQLMLRCQYCSTFIHASCCVSDIDDLSELFQSNWICERCIASTAAPSSCGGCVVCDRTTNYLMPYTIQPTSPLPSQQSPQPTKWIHAFCAKWNKLKYGRRPPSSNLCALSPTTSLSPLSVTDYSGRCDICRTKGRNLVTCGTCSKRFHAICAASQQYFILKSNKKDWRFYCFHHPPREAAAFDTSRQMWFTSETMAHLQELRHVLERGRMIIEMARQRDRQKKRMLNLCEMRRIELSLEMILKKRPTGTMKDMFKKITGEEIEDVPKRPAPVVVRKVFSKKRARTKSVDEDIQESEEKEEVVKRASSRLRVEPTVVEPTKPSRKRGGGVEEVVAVGERRSRRLEVQPEPVQAVPAQSSRKKRGVANDDELVALEMPTRKRSCRGEELVPEEVEQDEIVETVEERVKSRHRSRRTTSNSETDGQMESEQSEPAELTAPPTGSRRTARQRGTVTSAAVESESPSPDVAGSSSQMRRGRSSKASENSHEVESVREYAKKTLVGGLLGSTDTITVEDFDDVFLQVYPEASKK